MQQWGMSLSLYLPAVQREIPEKTREHCRDDREIPFLRTRKRLGSLLQLWKLLEIEGWSKDWREGALLQVAREDTWF